MLLKYLLCEKYCNYPMTTTLGDRFASCENIVFRFQTSSLPPPPATVYHLLVKNNKGMGGGLINFVPLKREGLLERGGLIEDLQKFFPFTRLSGFKGWVVIDMSLSGWYGYNITTQFRSWQFSYNVSLRSMKLYRPSLSIIMKKRSDRP